MFGTIALYSTLIAAPISGELQLSPKQTADQWIKQSRPYISTMKHVSPQLDPPPDFVDCDSFSSSACDQRIRFLVLHYTAADFQRSVELLSGPNAAVSAHYLIPDPSDESFQLSTFYPDAGQPLSAFSLVPESYRAWHAGISAWGNAHTRRYNINDQSIGIEIINLATDDFFPEFNEEQIDLVIALCQNILQRYPDIKPWHILGHSDIAWNRKIDPGPAFPWKKLYEVGIGVWYEESTVQSYKAQFEQNLLPTQAEFLSWLRRFGYVLDQETLENIEQLTRVFQMRFRPDCYNGKIDAETAAIAISLAERYFNEY